MEIENKKQLIEKVGKCRFIDDDYTLAAKLIYLTGINGFDKVLGEKSQYNSEFVIHISLLTKGIAIKLAKNFNNLSVGFTYNEIEKILIHNDSEFSILEIIGNEINIMFAFETGNKFEIIEFFKSKFKIEERSKLDVLPSKTLVKFKLIESTKIEKYISNLLSLLVIFVIFRVSCLILAGFNMISINPGDIAMSVISSIL